MKNATIKDIAEKAKVSTATVSRVLNNSGYASDAVRENVQKAAKQLNYKPNAIAKSLKLKKSNKIGVIIPDISNPYFMTIAKGMEDVIDMTGYHLIFASGNESIEKEEELIKLFLEERVDGLILATSGIEKGFLEQLKNTQVPIILLDRRLEGLSFNDYDHVIEENKITASKLTNKLIEKGAEKIGIVTGSLKVSTGKERLDGAMDSIYQQGLTLDDSNIFFGDFSIEAGREACNYFLKIPAKLRPDSFIILNNNMTQGFVECLVENNALDESITIASYGAISAQPFMPEGTMISAIQNPYEIGRKLGELVMLRIIEGVDYTDKPAQIIKFMPEFSFERR